MKQFTLRLPDDLHAQLKTLADANKRSLHGQILWLIEQATSGTPAPRKRPDSPPA